MKTVRPVIASNGVLYLQMMSVGSHSTSVRDEEKRKKTNKESHPSNVILEILVILEHQIGVVTLSRR